MHFDLKICHFLLFTLSIAEAGKSKNKGGNWHPWSIPMLGEYYKTIFVSQGVEKDGKNLTFLEPLMAIGILLTQD